MDNSKRIMEYRLRDILCHFFLDLAQEDKSNIVRDSVLLKEEHVFKHKQRDMYKSACIKSFLCFLNSVSHQE